MNVKLLKETIKRRDETSLKKVADAIEVSEPLLRKLLKGQYKFDLKDRTRYLIATGLGLSEDELFPVVSATESKSAS